MQRLPKSRTLALEVRGDDLVYDAHVAVRADCRTGGATDEELANVKFDYIRETYGYPHVVGHRASLANSLYAGCKKEPAIKFHLNTAVTSVSSFGPKPTIIASPRNGEPPYQFESDVLLGADGIKSTVRVEMLNLLKVDAQVVDTNQAAYRIMLHRDQLKHDPELLELINNDQVVRWIGPKRQIIAYPVSNKTIYNIATTQPDVNFAAAPSATYTTTGSKKEMLRVYEDFCPKIQRILNLVPDGEVVEWKLRVHSPLPTWVHGSVALVGDACHPTLPHLAQGAAQAIEDAAVIAVVLSRLPDASPQSINTALRVYQELRKERAETLVELAAISGKTLFSEGEAQQERDKQFAAFMQGKGKSVPDKWADADVQRMVYSHDCTIEAKESFDELFAKLSSTQANGSRPRI